MTRTTQRTPEVQVWRDLRDEAGAPEWVAELVRAPGEDGEETVWSEAWFASEAEAFAAAEAELKRRAGPC